MQVKDIVELSNHLVKLQKIMLSIFRKNISVYNELQKAKKEIDLEH